MASVSDIRAVKPRSFTRVGMEQLRTAGRLFRSYAPLLIAVLLYFLQTLPYISYRWVTDESWYSATAYSIAHGQGIKNPAIGPNDLENRIDARPPGTAIVIAAAFRAFGVSAISARLGSLLAGLVIVILTYTLARGIISERGAAIATFLVATDNLVILTCRSARPEALTVMMIVASLLALKAYAHCSRSIWILLSGLLMAMGTMFHVTLLGYVVSILMLAIVIDRNKRVFMFRGAGMFTFAYLLGLLPFASWIMSSPLGKAGFHQEFLNRAASPIFLRLLQEPSRYVDLLGLHAIHGHGLEHVPIRLPIPLIFIASSFLLWKVRRRWFCIEMALLIPSILWFIYTLNKSSRYLALLAPVFALTIAAAAILVQHRRFLHRICVTTIVLVVIAQSSANCILLYTARQANYNRLAAELRRAIPPGEVAYGTITFWLALHDTPFISYERTDPELAATRFHAKYFITGDRVMTYGLETEREFVSTLRREIASIEGHTQIVTSFIDPYYGPLTIRTSAP